MLGYQAITAISGEKTTAFIPVHHHTKIMMLIFKRQTLDEDSL
jgi:hypothetical protein